METLDFAVVDDEPDSPVYSDVKAQRDDRNDPEYEEVFVKSFKDAVDKIEEDNLFNENGFNVCLLDIDGVIFEDNMVKLPVVSHLSNPKITESCQNAYNKLITVSNGNVVISTNRSDRETVIFNSQNVLKQVKKLVNSNDAKIPIFTNLFKQKPGMTVEDISKVNNEHSVGNWSETQIIKPKIDALVHYIGKLATEREYQAFNLSCIEDWSIVSLNRKDFLLYVTEQLKQQYGIKIEGIKNYVVKR